MGDGIRPTVCGAGARAVRVQERGPLLRCDSTNHAARRTPRKKRSHVVVRISLRLEISLLQHGRSPLSDLLASHRGDGREGCSSFESFVEFWPNMAVASIPLGI